MLLPFHFILNRSTILTLNDRRLNLHEAPSDIYGRFILKLSHLIEYELIQSDLFLYVFFIHKLSLVQQTRLNFMFFLNKVSRSKKKKKRNNLKYGLSLILLISCWRCHIKTKTI